MAEMTSPFLAHSVRMCPPPSTVALEIFCDREFLPSHHTQVGKTIPPNRGQKGFGDWLVFLEHGSVGG